MRHPGLISTGRRVAILLPAILALHHGLAHAEFQFVRAVTGLSPGDGLDPWGIAVDSGNNVWVSDFGNSRVLALTPAGDLIRQISGLQEPYFPAAPLGLAIDSAQHVWVADGVQAIDQFSADGQLVSLVRDTNPTNFLPFAIAIGLAGDLWVANAGDSNVEQFDLNGNLLRQFGSPGIGNGQLDLPSGIAVDAHGHVWVADTGNNRIQEFSANGDYLSQIGSLGTGDGQFNQPIGIEFDPLGRLWVADTGNNRLQLFTGAGTYLGQFGSFGHQNGQFLEPSDLAFDALGNMWVVDRGNRRIQEFANVPEPSTLLLAVVGSLIVLATRRLRPGC